MPLDVIRASYEQGDSYYVTTLFEIANMPTDVAPIRI